MRLLAVLPLACLISCAGKKDRPNPEPINQLAKEYVKLALVIGQYDSDFVDAYYGPDSLKPVTPVATRFPKDSLLHAVDDLQLRLRKVASGDSLSDDAQRAKWLSSQLRAFSRRIKIFSGETTHFEEEAEDLFGVTVPMYHESFFISIVDELDHLLPGKGTINERMEALSNRFIIPKEKLDTVFETAIAEARRRTLQHFVLPDSEHFSLEFVTGKPWSGYNWYKGNYTSLIEINTDLKILIQRAIDVASHESYPGHHVYNMLLEKNLYRDKGWIEISLYPLFSPQSLIAEGSANYGIELAFPGKEKNRFAKEVLLPLAGVDTAGLDQYFTLLELKSKLNYVRNEVARGLVNKTMDENEALRWLMKYELSNRASAEKSISFIRKYRSYVINYNFGKDLVKGYIEREGITPTAKRWERFGKLLSNEVLTQTLVPNQ